MEAGDLNMDWDIDYTNKEIRHKDRFYVRDLATLTGFSPGWINEMIRQGKITGASTEMVLGTRRYVWPYDQLTTVEEQAKGVRKMKIYHRKPVHEQLMIPETGPLETTTWLTSADIAKELGRCQGTVRNAVHDGYLHVHHRDKFNKMFFSRSAVTEWRNGMKQRMHEGSVKASQTLKARKAGLVKGLSKDERIVTRKGAAKLAEVTKEAVYSGVKSGHLKVHRRGKTGKDFYRASDVLEWREDIKRRRHAQSGKSRTTGKVPPRLASVSTTVLAVQRQTVAKTRPHLLKEAEQVVDGSYSPTEFLNDVCIYRGEINRLKTDVGRLQLEVKRLTEEK